jgi:hypothetical protein
LNVVVCRLVFTQVVTNIDRIVELVYLHVFSKMSATSIPAPGLTPPARDIKRAVGSELMVVRKSTKALIRIMLPLKTLLYIMYPDRYV